MRILQIDDSGIETGFAERLNRRLAGNNLDFYIDLRRASRRDPALLVERHKARG